MIKAKKQRVKKIFDSIILLVSILLFLTVWYRGAEEESFYILIIPAVICAGAAAADLIYPYFSPGFGRAEKRQKASDVPVVQELVLLDEQNKPLKSWSMAGKTSLVIGRKNEDEEVDVDLEDCEYSTFIDSQHAALNYCLDSWFLEDLGSGNGTRVQKSEDGICYKVTNRPCRVMAGDIIYIANTQLLLT